MFPLWLTSRQRRPLTAGGVFAKNSLDGCSISIDSNSVFNERFKVIRYRLFTCVFLFCIALVVGCSDSGGGPTITEDQMSEAEAIAAEMEAEAEEEGDSAAP